MAYKYLKKRLLVAQAYMVLLIHAEKVVVILKRFRVRLDLYEYL